MTISGSHYDLAGHKKHLMVTNSLSVMCVVIILAIVGAFVGEDEFLLFDIAQMQKGVMWFVALSTFWIDEHRLKKCPVFRQMKHI